MEVPRRQLQRQKRRERHARIRNAAYRKSQNPAVLPCSRALKSGTHSPVSDRTAGAVLAGTAGKGKSKSGSARPALPAPTKLANPSTTLEPQKVGTGPACIQSLEDRATSTSCGFRVMCSSDDGSFGHVKHHPSSVGRACPSCPAMIRGYPAQIKKMPGFL